MVDAAELFEAISHPERIKILKILEKQSTSFASLKRQLGIESSGNLDFHLKKLGELVTVREDGLYGLTDAGKRALLSIDAVEVWAEMERRKARVFSEVPRQAFALGLLEICSSAVLVLWFLFWRGTGPLSANSLWGYVFFAALVLAGFRGGLGVFFRWRWSWTMVMAKSALIMSMSLFLLDYTWKHDWLINQPSYMALSYLAFVAIETGTLFLALKHPLRDFLGIGYGAKLPRLDLVGSMLCIFSGVLLILLESAVRFPAALNVNATQTISQVNTVFASLSDSTILCGLLMIAGGLLILIRSSMLGAIISIVFALFPPYLHSQYIPPPLPQQYTYHALELIWTKGGSSPYVPIIAVAVGSLPVIGGLLALYSVWRKIQR